MKLKALVVMIATTLVATQVGAYTRPNGQLDVGTGSAVVVCPAEGKRSMCAITNLDDADRLFCGTTSGVTASNGGIVVMPGATRFLDRDLDVTPSSTITEAIHCISNGDGARAAWDSVVR